MKDWLRTRPAHGNQSACSMRKWSRTLDEGKYPARGLFMNYSFCLKSSGIKSRGRTCQFGRWKIRGDRQPSVMSRFENFAMFYCWFQSTKEEESLR